MGETQPFVGAEPERPREAEGPVVARINPNDADFAHALTKFRQSMKLKGNCEEHINEACEFVELLSKRFAWQRYDHIREADLELVWEEMLDAKIGASTRNTRRSYVNCFFRVWRQKLLEIEPTRELRDPAAALPKAKKVEKQAYYVPEEGEVAALVSASMTDVRKKDRWAVYLVDASTGLRRSAIKKLEWQHAVEYENPPYLDVPARILKAGKRKKIWLTREAANALAKLRKERSPAGTDKIFRSVPTAKMFDRDLKKAGLRKDHGDRGRFCLHSLRHFASNRMEWQGTFTTEERQSQNTHETEAMTKKTYTDPNHAALGRKVERLAPLMRNPLDPKFEAQRGCGPPLTRNLEDSLLTQGGLAADTDVADPNVQHQKQLGHANEGRTPRDQRLRGERNLGHDRVFRRPRFSEADPVEESSKVHRFKSCHPDSDTDLTDWALSKAIEAFEILRAELRKNGSGGQETARDRDNSGSDQSVHPDRKQDDSAPT